MIKKISHLGMAVKDLEEAREFYRSVFKLESSEPIIGGDGTIRVSMVKVGEVLIELLQPIENEGVMAKFLEKRGQGFHHICYEVDDIIAAVSSLKASGLDILGEPKPGAEGMSVFLHPRGTHGVLVEFVEKEK
ncbi:MAG: methylmalonyl-CoA epimerase [Candidatus Aminicenantes bacterium]|jgi:methylmalonyl-CoA/ethylmalonyl-CoA epimerase|nr:methylmalonyl-CoA epimerase [Candidatus Aminicenantes bacterium]MDH5383682.1 methylmalonyl-CoA epimerase [Candidatus Aminicenantes bacterium]MDH5742396.1 methylmalonyl-CoA epimerase [Candidatus Aminicenantes bacterium]